MTQGSSPPDPPEADGEAHAIAQPELAVVEQRGGICTIAIPLNTPIHPDGLSDVLQRCLDRRLGDDHEHLVVAHIDGAALILSAPIPPGAAPHWHAELARHGASALTEARAITASPPGPVRASARRA